MRLGVCVPTLNAGRGWQEWLERVIAATPPNSRLLVIDSNSDDSTAKLAQKAGFELISIPREEFNHGATRQYAAEQLADCEILIFLTQDAILENSDSFVELCRAFDDPTTGAAYGRQLPHRAARPIEAHARLFNYSDTSYARSDRDIPLFGIKTAFLSNSFAAYRRSALEEVGGFPSNLILGEDMVVAARMLLNGWRVAYMSNARVYHSHDYTMGQEFRRYFDIGVFHKRESWLLESLGKPEGDGRRFVRSELTYLWKHALWLIPSALLRTLLKYAGYRLGRMEHLLPHWMKLRCSMHKGFWKSESRVTASMFTK